MENNTTKNALIGYSLKINDPAFTKYLSNSNRWSAIFAGGLAVIAVIGFFIAGETSSEMDNPESLYIGLGIGSMFLLIALYQIMSKKGGETWDGTVVDKKTEKKRRKKNSGDNDYYWEDYVVFTVKIKRDDNGKKHEIRVENDDTLYKYYQVGDKIRRHKGLNTYEKYDKSKDEIIFCNACASLNDINDDFCFRCKCPLLK